MHRDPEIFAERGSAPAPGSGPIDVAALDRLVEAHGAWVQPLVAEIGRVVVGQRQLVGRLLVGMLTGGHVLLEGVPGLAKTLSLKTLSQGLTARFQRIQFTPDMLPADIVGTQIYEPHNGEFRTRKGPVFANLVLADEINRAPAKVQSALLQAMQERQVTLGDRTWSLPDPFLVMATQNPVEQEGTYRLPEAQMDRFLLKVNVDYPSPVEERAILDAMATTAPKLDVRPVVELEQVMQARAVVDRVYLDERLKHYIVDLVVATREPARYGLSELGALIRYGASPRATIGLALAARAWAFLRGRGYVTPEDVKNIAPDVLRHRVGVTYEAEARELDAEHVVARVLDHVPIP